MPAKDFYILEKCFCFIVSVKQPRLLNVDKQEIIHKANKE